MLTKSRITLEAMTIVNDAEICRHIAIITAENNEVSMFTRMIDKNACKEHRDIVRADRAAFEDWAYSIQDQHKEEDINVGLDIE